MHQRYLADGVVVGAPGGMHVGCRCDDNGSLSLVTLPGACASQPGCYGTRALHAPRLALSTCALGLHADSPPLLPHAFSLCHYPYSRIMP